MEIVVEVGFDGVFPLTAVQLSFGCGKMASAWFGFLLDSLDCKSTLKNSAPFEVYSLRITCLSDERPMLFSCIWDGWAFP